MSELRLFGSGSGPIAGSYEYGGKTLGSIKDGDFFLLSQPLSASQERLCSMLLATHIIEKCESRLFSV
jgi:hypothetical protein